MNSDRSDLAALRRELDRVETDIRLLRLRADQLEQRIAVAPEPIPAAAIIQESLLETPPPPPPVKPPPLPPIIPKEIIEEPVFKSQPILAPAAEPTLEPAPAFATAAAEPEKPASFELRLGTYWFVRIGIVMLLTAMVFLGNYAYQHYIPHLGPWGKMVLLYLGSFGLLAAGTILPRRQERLKNYAQVLFAGGLAAVHFTTYAAHHFPNLKVIQSALVDGLLLLGWTAYIVWLADRKKSELLAVFAIGLAYYTALITNVGNFTLVSNLLLGCAAVFFLVRNRWVNLSFISLIACYGTYFYWRYFAGTEGVNFEASRYAIVGYWTVFTAAVFLARHADFVGRRRASFLSFNNAAAFAILTASYYGANTGGFWKLSLLAGAILLGLAAAARQVIQGDELPRRAYLTQGLFLITLGLISKFSGPTLSLILAVESALLLVFSTQWKSRLLQHASIIVAGLAVLFYFGSLSLEDANAWIKAGSLGALFLFSAVWSAKTSDAQEEVPLRFRPSYYTFLSLITITAAVFNYAERAAMGPILAVIAIGLTFFHYATRVREITYLSQGLLVLAQFQTLSHLLDSTQPVVNFANPLIVTFISIAMALWWKRQQILPVETQARLPLQLISAFAAAGIIYAWLPREFTADHWIAVAAGLTVAWTAFAGFTRSWPLGAAGQIFLLGTSLQTLLRLASNNEPAGIYPTLLILALVALAAGSRFAKVREEAVTAVRGLGTAYQWLAAVLTLACVMNYVAAPNRLLMLVGLFVISLIPALRGVRYTFAPGLFLAIAGLAYWLAEIRAYGAAPQNLLALLILGAAQWTLRKKPETVPLPEGAHQFWIITVATAIWIFVSRWVIDHSAGAHFYLTASWAALAFLFFLAGFAVRERAYRWSALGLLTCALARVVLLDVWNLATIYRILSFLALGLVLVVLGYIYNRYQEKFSKWL